MKSILLTVAFCVAEAWAQPDTLWTRRYAGTQIYGGDITGDAAGNIYVCGQGFDNFGDYLVVKYNSAGALQWARTYNGPGSAYDLASALAVDASGNVYVTGNSYGGAATDADYCTIKYTSNGDTAWVRRHHGYPASTAIDVATDIVVDAGGNSYVTGYGPGPASPVDVFTIKYAPNGDSLWGQYYNFPATNGGDHGWAITLDDSGNVIVAGDSWGGTQIPPATGNDYLVLKYTSGGSLVFARRQKGSPGSSDDQAQAVATDASGNIFVTGFAQAGAWYVATFRFSSGGDSLWQSNYTPPGLQGKRIAVRGGGVYVAGDTYEPNYLTLKYNTAGVLQWARQYDNGGSDMVFDMKVDTVGNVYVFGTSAGVFNGDFVTVKYNSLGDSLWVERYDTYDDIGRGLHVFAPGQFAVCGSSFGTITTVRYTETPVFVDEDQALPQRFELFQNYPNPFNPSTRIRFEIGGLGLAAGRAGFVSVKIFDVLGQEVVTLVNEELKPGSYEVTWEATGMASGVYLYRLQAGAFVKTKRLVLLR